MGNLCQNFVNFIFQNGITIEFKLIVQTIVELIEFYQTTIKYFWLGID